MSKHKKYGLCRACDTWLPRDDMLGINVKTFDQRNDEKRITIRLCRACHKSEIDALQEVAWVNDLRTVDELRTSGVADSAIASLAVS